MLTYPVCWVWIGFYCLNRFYDHGNGYMEEKTVGSVYFIEAHNLPIDQCHAESNLELNQV